MLKAFIVALLLPGSVQAVEFPKWELVGDFACFTFEKAKKLRVAENECLTLELDHDKLVTAVESYEELSKLQNEVILKLQDSNKTLSELLAKMEDDRDNAEVKSAIAQGRSITGGGLPWIIAGAAVAFAGGMYLGYRVSR